MGVRRNQYQPATYLNFDGKANSYVALAATNVLPNATAACSFWARIYIGPLDTGSTDAIRVIIGNRRDSTTAGWVFKVANKAKDKTEFAFFDQNSSSQGDISTYTVPGYRWCEVGCSFDGRTTIFYIDGNIDTAHTLGVAKTITEYTGQNLRIGHRQAAGSTFETFAGSMAGLCVWNRVVTPAEFASIYKTQVIPTSGSRAYWPMVEGAGTTIADSIGGFTGTLTGGVTWGSIALNMARSPAIARPSAISRVVAGSRIAV